MVSGGLGGCDLAELRAWTTRLSAYARGAVGSDDDRLEKVRAMEELRSALAAAQAAEVAALAAERRVAVEVEIASVPRPGVGRNRRRQESERRMVAEVALARRISPWQAQRFVTYACAAPVETPLTFELLAAGAVSERRAVTVQQLASVLPAHQRSVVDAEIAPDLAGWGDRRVDRETRAAVYRLDPAGACARAAHAQNERRVSTRPAPDTMAWLTVLAPMPQVVACRAALEAAARAGRAAGDSRTRAQIMADTVVERITGQTVANDVPVAIQLVITDRTLTGGDTPARFADGTPYPAPLARELALGDRDSDEPGRAATARRVRRLFTDPAGQVVTAETHSRAFTPAMAEFVRLRDTTCTTPWCDAPIRHIDHHDPRVRGGPTSLVNARGTCEWCNETKGDRAPVDLAASDPPRPPRRPRRRSPLERRARRLVRTAARRPGLVVDLPSRRCTAPR